MSEYAIAIWGLVANWFAAVGTVGALFATIAIVIADRRRARRAAADAFVTWHSVSFVDHPDGRTDWTLVIHGFNGGSLPIPYAIVQSAEKSPQYMFEFLSEEDGKIRAIQPGDTYTVEVPMESEPDMSTVFVVFGDARGQKWNRHLVNNTYFREANFKMMMNRPEYWKYKTRSMELPHG